MCMGSRYLNYGMTEIEIEHNYTYKTQWDNLSFLLLKIAKKSSLIPSTVSVPKVMETVYTCDVSMSFIIFKEHKSYMF